MTRGGWGDGTLTQVAPGKWALRLPPYLGRRQITFPAVNKTAAKKEQRRLLEHAYREKAEPSKQRFTFNEWCERALDRHVADPHTIDRMRRQLKSPLAVFGDKPLDELAHDTIASWRADRAKQIAATTLRGETQSVKQMLNAAVHHGVIVESPGRHIKNPAAETGLISPFETLGQVEAFAAEFTPEFQGLPVFGCLTGLRVEELLALERADIRDGYIHVNKRYTKGTFKQGTKTGVAERRVFLDPLAKAWLDRQPTRIDTRLLWANPDGGYLNMDHFRTDVWNPAMKAAGIVPARRPKDMRHTYATWQLAGNCNTWTLSKQMGTSVKMIEDTYGRWIQGSEQVLLQAMSAFLERAAK